MREEVIVVTVFPHPHRLHLHRPHVNPWLVAVVGLAAALIGLGAWVVVDHYTGSSSTEQATTLIDEFSAASSRNDGPAVGALFTSDAVMSLSDATFTGPQEIADEVALTPGLSIERIAPVSVSGEYATTLISYWADGGAVASPMLSVAQMKDGKIARLWTFAFGVTKPFTSVAD